MLINSHPLNANGNDALRIYMKRNELHSLRLTDIIETTIQILIIDECSRRRASSRRNTIEAVQSIANVALSPSARRIQNAPLLLSILLRVHIFHEFPNPFLVRITLIADFAELPAQQVLHHQVFWCLLLLSDLKPANHSKACPRQNGLF